MTVGDLIKILEDYPENKIVVIVEPDGRGWANIDRIRTPQPVWAAGTIYLIPEKYPIFSDN